MHSRHCVIELIACLRTIKLRAYNYACTIYHYNYYIDVSSVVKLTSSVVCSVQKIVIFFGWLINKPTIDIVTFMNTINHPQSLLVLLEAFILLASFVTI